MNAKTPSLSEWCSQNERVPAETRSANDRNGRMKVEWLCVSVYRLVPRHRITYKKWTTGSSVNQSVERTRFILVT